MTAPLMMGRIQNQLFLIWDELRIRGKCDGTNSGMEKGRIRMGRIMGPVRVRPSESSFLHCSSIDCFWSISCYSVQFSFVRSSLTIFGERVPFDVIESKNSNSTALGSFSFRSNRLQNFISSRALTNLVFLHSDPIRLFRLSFSSLDYVLSFVNDFSCHKDDWSIDKRFRLIWITRDSRWSVLEYQLIINLLVSCFFSMIHRNSSDRH